MGLKRILHDLSAELAKWLIHGQVRRHLRELERGRALQDRVLQEKLKLNADSALGKALGLRPGMSAEEFRCAVPITTYDHYRTYVQRMLEGDASALLGSGQKAVMFALTSGTTDEPKHIPVSKRFVAEYRRGWHVWGLLAYEAHPDAWLRPILQISAPLCEHRAPCGLPCGAISGLLARTQIRVVRRYYAVPPEAAGLPDPHQRHYLALRLAVHRDIGMISTANPSTLVELARLMDARREDLIRDVRDGTLAGDVPLEARARRALRPALRPAPAAAERLARLVAEHGRLLPRHVWRPGYIGCWTGGTLGLYIAMVEEMYGHVPIRDIGLLASEGRMSLPLRDGTPEGLLDATSHFFEFLPTEEMDAAQPAALRSDELEVGREYAVVLTTSSGLWRYNIGDVVRVNGYRGGTPLIEFLNKGKHISSVTGEKLAEGQVVRAVGEAARLSGLRLTSFVLCPHWEAPPFYALNVHGDEAPEAMRSAFVAEVDAGLQQLNVEYSSKRASGRLGPVRLRLLPAGTLGEWDAARRARQPGRSEQYKHPFLLSTIDGDRELGEARNADRGETPRMHTDGHG